MDTIELKSSLYNLIDRTKDIDILQAIEILLKKQFKSLEISELDDEFELSDEHKKNLDERLESYQKNPKDLISWEKVKEQIYK
ncbi:MAG: addiction module protein [Bacteroidales bacterium]|nr:addiction module protein [Bacteroidales bacterium]